MMMNVLNSRFLSAILAVSMLVSLAVSQTGLHAQAATPTYRKVYDARLHQYVYVQDRPTLKARTANTLRNPIVRNGLIGAGVGGLAGAVSRGSVGKGILVGGATGAGTGLIDTSTTLRDRPYIKNTLKGAAIGTGASIVTERSALKGAGIGAGVGLGAGALGEYLRKN